MESLDVLLTVVATLLNAVVFAVLVRRIAGAPISLVRATIASLLATSIAQPILKALVGEPLPVEGEPTVALGLYLCLLAAFAVVLALLLLVLAEMIIPDGSLPGPVELWRSWRSRLSRGRRYAEIVGIVTKHGLSRFLRGRRPAGASSSAERRELARALRRTLEEGGVTFVKLGQQLSTRRDLLPPEFIDELSLLQDAARPLAWPLVHATISSAWGRPPESVLSTIDPEPLGSASVAQVHAATLLDGTPVVIKVQRPGIADNVERDLDIVRRLAATLAARTEWADRLGLRALADGFAAALREELDFSVELSSTTLVASELARTHANRVRGARTYPHLSTPRLLVMERLSGTPLGAAEPLLASLGPQRRSEIADTLLDVVMGQVLRTGVFHVDLHPGNILVDDDGTLGLLDLGSVGRLGEATRDGLTRLFGAIGTGSSQAAADALLDVVERPEEVDEQALEQAVAEVILRFGSGGQGAGAAAFTALFRVVSDHGLGIPPAVAAVFRAVATLEGTLLVADPGYDLSERVRVMGREQLGQATSPAQLRAGLEREAITLLPVLRRLPRRLDRLTDAAEHGRLSLGVRLLADRRDRELVTRLWHQGIMTVIAATAGIMAALLFTVGPGPSVAPGIGLFWVLGGALLCIATVLALRVLMAVLRRPE
ncbi:ABC1 kinase family protein [Pseudactinotalea suaedae]|uniref:ABC1 kinase family protein n=1 Tax=Pseudactinotalea suaedae TaxID=1524924 RepID=UPI0012E1974B|nr:AarF/UbiB family protein [Pseudactinotalea suaedae]